MKGAAAVLAACPRCDQQEGSRERAQALQRQHPVSGDGGSASGSRSVSLGTPREIEVSVVAVDGQVLIPTSGPFDQVPSVR